MSSYIDLVDAAIMECFEEPSIIIKQNVVLKEATPEEQLEEDLRLSGIAAEFAIPQALTPLDKPPVDDSDDFVNPPPMEPLPPRKSRTNILYEALSNPQPSKKATAAPYKKKPSIAKKTIMKTSSASGSGSKPLSSRRQSLEFVSTIESKVGEYKNTVAKLWRHNDTLSRDHQRATQNVKELKAKKDRAANRRTLLIGLESDCKELNASKLDLERQLEEINRKIAENCNRLCEAKKSLENCTVSKEIDVAISKEETIVRTTATQMSKNSTQIDEVHEKLQAFINLI